MAKDLYEILGVARDASQEEVRRAYLRLAHKFHPDKTGGDVAAEEKLKEVNGAYDVLKNPEKRRRYDQFGTADAGDFGGAGAGGFGGYGAGGFEAPFEDFFDMLFGQHGGRRRAAGEPGRDVQVRVTITLEEAARGVKKKVSFARQERCDACHGSGAEPGSQPQICGECNGAGQVRVAHGFFSVTRTCPKCRGTGRIITKPCKSCSGQGQVRKHRDLNVDIPAGVDTGSRLRITGEGEAGTGNAPRGDLYVLVEMEQHEIFERDGATILCELPVTFSQAALGDTVRVPTLNGNVDLKIPAGSQSGQQLRLRGFGLPDLRGYRQGDQLVELRIETPSKLNRKQRELLREFEAMADERTYPNAFRFRDRTAEKKR